jgi:predicted HicB family RNase H-like nuclease
VKPRDTIILPARVKIPIANEAKAQAKRDGITMNQWLNEAIKLRLSKGL